MRCYLIVNALVLHVGMRMVMAVVIVVVAIVVVGHQRDCIKRKEAEHSDMFHCDS